MFTRKIAWVASVVLAAGLAVGAAGAAHADPVGVGVVQNNAGEAGYFANDNGQTRFRDVQTDLVVTNQIKNLNGATATQVGAAGAELCDPNSGKAAQIGVYWDKSTTPNRFRVAYATGTFTTALDPCIQNGLVNPVPTTFLLDLLTINAGDHLHFEIYWNPKGFFHRFTFKVCDVTQDICRQAQSSFTGFLNLYEAGVGVVTQQTALTAPPLNQLVTFTNNSFNYYSSTKAWGSIFVPSHWELKRADFVNSSFQPVMSSNGSLDNGGHAFTMFNGSTSA